MCDHHSFAPVAWPRFCWCVWLQSWLIYQHICSCRHTHTQLGAISWLRIGDRERKCLPCEVIHTWTLNCIGLKGLKAHFDSGCLWCFRWRPSKRFYLWVDHFVLGNGQYRSAWGFQEWAWCIHTRQCICMCPRLKPLPHWLTATFQESSA